MEWARENGFVCHGTGGGCACLRKPIMGERDMTLVITAECEVPSMMDEVVEIGLYAGFDEGEEPIAATEVLEGLNSIDAEWLRAFTESHT